MGFSMFDESLHMFSRFGSSKHRYLRPHMTLQTEDSLLASTVWGTQLQFHHMFIAYE